MKGKDFSVQRHVQKPIIPIILSLLLFIIMACCSAPIQAEPIRLQFFAPNSPPQGIVSSNRKGFMIEIAEEAAKRAGYAASSDILPWPRTLTLVSEGKDLFIAGLSRFPAREDQFTWVYPVYTLWRAFITTGPKINSYAEGKLNLKAVATHYGSLETTILRDEGFREDQLVNITNETPQLDFLLAGRVDALYRPVLEIQWLSHGNPDAHRLVYGTSMQPTEQYIACSRDCSPELVAGMRKALTDMDNDGTTNGIIQSYTTP